MQRFIIPAVACLSALGCATAPEDASPPVTVRTQHTAYRPVELVVITTTNPTGATVYDDHCGGEVQGYEFLKRWNASYGVAGGCRDIDATDWRSRSVAIPPG